MTLREAVPCALCGAVEIDATEPSSAQLSRSDEVFTFVRCARCALVRLSPRPPDSELGRWYEDYLLHEGARAWGRYARFVERSQATQDRARVRTVLRVASVDARSRVLDVGCGRPTFLAELVGRTGAHGVGVDLSDAGWRDESQRFSGLELHAATLAHAPLDGSFDVVTAWHALEHDPAPVAALRRLRALTKPGGRLVVEVPDAAGLTRRLQGGRWAGFHTPRHMSAFTPATLRATVSAAGWHVESLRRYGSLDPWVLFWLGQVGSGRALPASLEGHFVPFVLGKIATWPLAALQRFVPLGVQTLVARAP